MTTCRLKAQGSRLRLLISLTAALSAWAGVASAQTRDWPTERIPRPLAAKESTFPPYQVQTLANGLQVIVVEQHEQPSVSLRLIVRAGSALEQRNRLGLA